jgi:enolase
MHVKNLKIRQIFTTTSKETVEAELETEKGVVRASVPAGTSVGKHEAVYLPIEKVMKNFSLIKREFLGKDFSNQEEVDSLLHDLDGTKNFSKLGGNLALAISSAFLKGFALNEGKEVFEFLTEKPKIPKPVCNVVGGWKGQSDIQEYLLLPTTQKSFFDSIERISLAYHEIGKYLKDFDKNFNFGKNIESAWVTNLNCEKILEIVAQIATQKLLKIGLDVAASQLFDGKNYVYLDGRKLSAQEQLDFIKKLVENYPIEYVEDPFEEDDFASFSKLRAKLGEKLVVGDDLLVTNLNRLKIGIVQKAINAAIVKPSQVGTISDVIEFVKEAKRNDIATIMSHRSGETEDTLICHLAVGLGCDFIKLGISGERTVKINEMIRIEEKLQK